MLTNNGYCYLMQLNFLRKGSFMNKGRKGLIKNARELFANSEQIKALPEMLSAQQVADLYQRSIHTIYRWVSQGKFDYCSSKEGKKLSIYKSLLIAGMFPNNDSEGVKNEKN
jgi:hypothetical protein